jgi:UDP-N-acetylmuramyl-tripeptide synthetase
MATLPNPLKNPEQAVQWLRERVSGSLSVDSRQVGNGDGFVAWPGAATDGRHFVSNALAQGAAACLVEQEAVESFGFDNPRVASYSQLKAATGPIAAAYYNHPSHQMDLVAVTGTNGKTSTAWWLAQALTLGQTEPPSSDQTLQNKELLEHIPCAVVGTLGMGVMQEAGAVSLSVTGMTTPDPVLLHGVLREWVTRGVKTCVIEASSIGIHERRLDGTCIRVAIFTNFTQDHLDYHGTMAAYWQAKRTLFDWPGLQAAVVNIDDAQGAQLVASLNPLLDVWTVSCRGAARLVARDMTYHDGGLRFTVIEANEQHTLQTAVIGEYNVSNLLGVIAGLRALGVPLAQAVQACTALTPVPGRMECLGGQQMPLVAVDYAHTPDALAHVLAALQPLARQRGGKLWCVFGCGGDRDASKRPLMAAAAQKGAQRVVITSDNSRSEKPLAIIEQIFAGLSTHEHVRIQPDRATAVAQAIADADVDDVVLVAGKGHEGYQEVMGVKHPFSDQAHVLVALQARGLAILPLALQVTP